MAQRILVVEDDAALGEGLRLTLEPYDCTLAATLAEGAPACSGNALTWWCWTSTCRTAAGWTCCPAHSRRAGRRC